VEFRISIGCVAGDMAFKYLSKGAAIALLVSKARAVDNGLAITPQMGCKSFPFQESKFETYTNKNRGQLE
jgi:hypothetical protein